MRLFEAISNLVRGGTSAGYEVVDDTVDADGWRSSDIAVRQHAAYSGLLRDLRANKPRRDLQVAADAVRAFGLARISLVEIGCGSGYYSEVFERLVPEVEYRGVDYSLAMTALARSSYPGTIFVAADAASLPFAPQSFDVAFSGNSLMHIPLWREAIAETVRVARRGCVFHSVPVLEQRPTTRLRKRAYGSPVFEIIFHRAELEAVFAASGLVIRSAEESMTYDLESLLGEHTRLLTYTCDRT